MATSPPSSACASSSASPAFGCGRRTCTRSSTCGTTSSCTCCRRMWSGTGGEPGTAAVRGQLPGASGSAARIAGGVGGGIGCRRQGLHHAYARRPAGSGPADPVEASGSQTLNRVAPKKDDPFGFELVVPKTPLQERALSLLEVEPERIVSSRQPASIRATAKRPSHLPSFWGVRFRTIPDWQDDLQTPRWHESPAPEGRVPASTDPSRDPGTVPLY